MPKLHGWREWRQMNLYDALTPDELRRGPTRMFGFSNIDDPVRSNLAHAGYSPSGHGTWDGPPLGDQAAVLLNWYARTNLPGGGSSDAWNAFIHATTLELVVGPRIVANPPLADLLARKEGQYDPGSWDPGPWVVDQCDEECDEELVEVACAGHAAYHDLPVIDLDQISQDTTLWSSMPDAERQRWYRVTRAMLHELRVPLLAVVPVRMGFGVNIQTDARALGAMLEVMPTHVAPQVLIWVHLEGVMKRYVI